MTAADAEDYAQGKRLPQQRETGQGMMGDVDKWVAAIREQDVILVGHELKRVARIMEQDGERRFILEPFTAETAPSGRSRD